VVTLQFQFCVKEHRVGSRMARAEGLGASAQLRQFGFEFFHEGFFVGRMVPCRQA
jgi:hypothetical protein